MPDNPMPFPATPWVIKPLVPDEVYTDRTEFLEYFYETALKAVTRRPMSTVLLGQRRMGKTEIFRRVVNRLFFEQDPQSPNAIVPVYYSFPDEQQDRLNFAIDYLENFMCYYVGFYTQQPEGIRRAYRSNQLLEWIENSRSLYSFQDDLDLLLSYRRSLLNGGGRPAEKDAVEIPRRISDIYDSTIVVFLDEFQNTHLPQDKFRIVGYMKEAVESNTCPHFVTGSAMSILAREILGRGALFGRFDSDPIEPLSDYWGAELAMRAARYYGAEVPQLMAPVVASRCGGNPFYIVALIRQAAKLGDSLVDEETINRVLAVDIASGFIWAELYEQVNGWIERINEHGITKWILYLSALEESDRISLERIQSELKAKEGKDVPLDTIREILVRLSRGDLLEYRELGNWFHGVDDPILLEFIKVWGRVDVEGQNQVRVQNELLLRYETQSKRIHEYKGYLAEVFMAQVLLNSYQHKSYPAHFFNASEDIPLRRPVIFVHHRVRPQSGTGKEIDVLASLGGHMWVCQSKWETTKKTSVATVQELIGQAATVQAQYNPRVLHKWIFAHQGLTQEALKLAQQAGVLWSDREQLDALLTYLGLRTLPELDG
ncbi:restriction endonuclease [Chloroflexi bacterium TSY]|nr:restriction endonuclease [Chloroflexi bacterium TSY]